MNNIYLTKIEQYNLYGDSKLSFFPQLVKINDFTCVVRIDEAITKLWPHIFVIDWKGSLMQSSDPRESIQITEFSLQNFMHMTCRSAWWGFPLLCVLCALSSWVMVTFSDRREVMVIPWSPGIYHKKPPEPEGVARGRSVVFRDKSMVTMV